VVVVYTVSFSLNDEASFWRKNPGIANLERLPDPAPSMPVRTQQPGCIPHIIIVGMGPAGLFCALRLAHHGLSATLIERGKAVEERIKDVSRFWQDGTLDTESNVQFGEGGAGTFSDGKLTCRLRDPNSAWILEQLVRFGAPPEIRYLAKPTWAPTGCGGWSLRCAPIFCMPVLISAFQAGLTALSPITAG